MDQITFITETGEPVVFFVLEQTVISGRTYLLVTDQEEGDAECWMLRLTDDGQDEDGEAAYEMVEDADELEAVGKVFAALLDDETTLLTE